MRWDGSAGHYEVWYLTLTDPAGGVGAWIRLTMVAPLAGEATCSLWFLAMDPATGELTGRKATYPIGELTAAAQPFALCVAGATLDDRGTRGAFEDVAWDLRWAPGRPYEHVHPVLRRARIAKTVLTLPHGDVLVHGSITLPGGRDVAIDGARGGQAHLWGSKHAERWAWAHAGDLTDEHGAPVRDTFLDGVSVYVPRLGREVGPSTPVVGRFLGEDFGSRSPRRVLANRSAIGLTGWRFEVLDGHRRVVGTVDARRDLLAGVTYQDPDGDLAHCYNTEVASAHLSVFDRAASGRRGWMLRQTLVADRRAHFEYAQRAPVPDLPLLV
ncbi:hypothetical protein DSM104329_02716 [Capillimicrobium parvum]|uniref:Uncharacterized protein n=2 Tax=Capillimicrobium parvum TaxID=2884022 RepID=A0A9E7C184_9ACTN|nr:hypothetical protein DSM104329_02716 [Capillimicrobium parvum]